MGKDKGWFDNYFRLQKHAYAQLNTVVTFWCVALKCLCEMELISMPVCKAIIPESQTHIPFFYIAGK